MGWLEGCEEEGNEEGLRRRDRGDFAPDEGDAATAEGPGWEESRQSWGCSRAWGVRWRDRETPTAQGQEQGK